MTISFSLQALLHHRCLSAGEAQVHLSLLSSRVPHREGCQQCAHWLLHLCAFVRQTRGSSQLEQEWRHLVQHSHTHQCRWHHRGSGDWSASSGLCQQVSGWWRSGSRRCAGGNPFCHLSRIDYHETLYGVPAANGGFAYGGLRTL